MENKQTRSINENRGLHGLAALDFKNLIRVKEENDQDGFDKLMQPILPDLKSYIAHRLSTSVRKGELPSGKYKVEDFVDELYLKAFEQIGEVDEEKDLHPWLFEKADELLNDAIVEEEFNEVFFKDIDKITKAEWEQMHEDFSNDGDGGLMLLEEFDDPSYPKYEYQLADVFVQESPEAEWIEKLNTEIGHGKIHQHIDMVLRRLPAPMRSIYDLAVNQGFKPYEIAKIKHISGHKVEQYLAKVRQNLQVSIEKRYPR